MENGKGKMENVPVRCGCGGEARFHETESGLVYISCERCDTATRLFRTEAEAVTVWNRAMHWNHVRYHPKALREME